ncbi:MAG TPA: hypothetical protein VNO32_30315, partial [Candidatus Acidoferrum sp.]|nr:hypothetical protein [Candidatus Acidoferrum sp.]
SELTDPATDIDHDHKLSFEKPFPDVVRSDFLVSDGQASQLRSLFSPTSHFAFRPIFFSPLHCFDVKCIQDISDRACNYCSNGESAGGIFALIGGDKPKGSHTPLSPAGTKLKSEEIPE